MGGRIALAILIVFASQGGANVLAQSTRSAIAPRQSATLKPSYFPAARFVLPMAHPQGNPIRVELHVSRDAGRTWQGMDAIRYAGGRPSADQFTIQAPEDGPYWFAVRTLFQSHADPRGDLQPSVHVIVDTQQPELVMRVLAGGSGELVAQWEASDRHLDPQTLRIEYQAGERGEWQSVPLKESLDPKAAKIEGETIWWPHSNAEGVNVRIEVKDRAGNRRQAQQWHPLAKIAQRKTAGNNDVAGRGAGQTPGSIPWPAERGAGSSQPPYANRPAPPSAPAAAMAKRNPAVDGQGNAVREDKTARRADSQLAESGPNKRLSDSGWTSRDADRVQTEPRPGPVHPPVAYRPNVKASPISRTLLKQLPSGDLPSMTNSRQFEFDYDVDAVGRDGVSRVELYRTLDAGRSWQLDQKVDNPDPQKALQVSVPEEGIYGYRVVVVARNGLASRRPGAGDQADLWIGVDTTAPIVRLTGAVYGKEEHAGKLAIRWQADDALFGERPITIRFSESADGPWNSVASGLPNTGQYFWAADPRTPEKIFLRIEVRDAAGNTAVDQLERPIQLEGLIPRGRIRGFRPIRK